MQAAPAVSASLDGGRLERVLIALLHALTGAALLAWVQGLAELAMSWLGWIAAAALVAATAWLGAVLARSALPGNALWLRWDAQVWTLVLRPSGNYSGAELVLTRLEVALDLGSWLLLRIHPAAGGVRWQVARASSVGSAWHGLRVALMAHAGSPATSPADRRGP